MASCSACTRPQGTSYEPKNFVCMSDGRAFTDYRPRYFAYASEMAAVTSSPQYYSTPYSSYESRMYMQQNATQIIEQNRVAAEKHVGTCKRPLIDPGTIPPEQYVVRCNTVSCQRFEVSPGGIGDGRQYATGGGW